MSFAIALSGINAINDELTTISNNIANSSTDGFKSTRSNFSSIYAGSQPTGTEVSSLTQSIGIGGSIVTTGRNLDAAIQGRGFFVTHDSSGAEVYTRAGSFSTDKNGYIVDSFGRRVQGYAAVTGTSALGALGDLQVPTGQIAAQSTTAVQYVGNLSADWTTPTVAPFNPTNAQSFNGSSVSLVYDSLGVQHTVTQYFVKSGSNQVTVNYAFDGTVLATTQNLTFNTNGQLTAPAAPVSLNLGAPAGASPLTVALNYSGTTEFAGDFTTTTNTPDGYASGTFTGVQLAGDGSIEAQYSNGQKQTIGTVALATFPDEDALVPVSNTAWTSNSASGSALYFTPGKGMAGSLSAGSLEQSNVDMTSQLVDLMSAQRNYQANSKMLSTENQMLQTLIQAI
jgi:flagellar hook protein FlgE